jgi:hypothetical protein
MPENSLRIKLFWTGASLKLKYSEHFWFLFHLKAGFSIVPPIPF